MKKILFLHDTSLSLLRGAELTIQQLIALGNKRGFVVSANLLNNFGDVAQLIRESDLVIVNSTSRCSFEKELLRLLIVGSTKYIKVEYDHNFCIRRNILCTVDRNYRLCCDTVKFHLHRDLFAHASLNIFQSPKHYDSHEAFFGEAVKNHMIMPPTIDVTALDISFVKDEETIPFFGDLSFLKGGDAYIEYAEQNPDLRFEVYGDNKLKCDIPTNVHFNEPLPNAEVMKILGRTKYLFCKPIGPEASGRLVAEAFLSGCQIIGNDRIGTFSFDFYPNDIERAKLEIQQAPEKFWAACETVIASSKRQSPSLGKVLVYKSYGGLGDIFFCIPSLHTLLHVSDEVTFAVAPRLVSFFSEHLKNITVVDETVARLDESRYDKVIELGNYPAFRGYDLPHALRYPTHKRVKQHAIAHYVDAVAKLHPDCDVSNKSFPYFERHPNFHNPYYTLHPGAGFLLKIWPTENYAKVIKAIHQVYPMLRCKIILGPEDPNPVDFFDSDVTYVDFVTGGIDDVGQAMSGALFHIGNDAGITHVAGAFNVPTVGIYGPTGPGSWGSFAEKSEIIWGKAGHCELKCNYDVIMNCADRVCLSSTTPNTVMAALYKLLQRSYPAHCNQWMVNPKLTYDIRRSDCLLNLSGNEFLVNFADQQTRQNVCNVLSGDFRNMDAGDMPAFTSFLREQNIIFMVPNFTALAAANRP